MNRLAAYEEVLTIIADRHGLYVYFDFDIDINILRFRFYLNDCEIYKGCLKLSEIISHNVFELLEKEVEKRIERLNGKPHDKKGGGKMSDLKETVQRINNLKEALERQKRREPGTFERYNYEILDYLRYKFPEESESAIREAAAFISNRTAVVIQDMNAEMSREYMRAFYNIIRKGEK